MLVSIVSERASERRSWAVRGKFIAEPLNLHSHTPEFMTFYASYLPRILREKKTTRNNLCVLELLANALSSRCCLNHHHQVLFHAFARVKIATGAARRKTIIIYWNNVSLFSPRSRFMRWKFIGRFSPRVVFKLVLKKVFKGIYEESCEREKF